MSLLWQRMRTAQMRRILHRKKMQSRTQVMVGSLDDHQWYAYGWPEPFASMEMTAEQINIAVIFIK